MEWILENPVSQPEIKTKRGALTSHALVKLVFNPFSFLPILLGGKI
jgi:hypothetical protein